jgi:hypothetical protein
MLQPQQQQAPSTSSDDEQHAGQKRSRLQQQSREPVLQEARFQAGGIQVCWVDTNTETSFNLH